MTLIRTKFALIVSLLLCSCLGAQKVQFGVDRLVHHLDTGDPIEGVVAPDKDANLKNWLKKQSLGLISNFSSRLNDAKTFTESALVEHLPIQSFFYLEHGRTAQIEASVAIDSESKAHIFSLYGPEASLSPSFEALDTVTALIYCVPDVGSRCYTYAASLFYVMDALKAYRVKTGKTIALIILDRPNPLGALTDGIIREKAWQSLMSHLEAPFCHGLTVGEQARFYNAKEKLLEEKDLIIVPVANWNPSQIWQDTGLEWVQTSPNMASLETLNCYPVTVVAEGLDFINAGRGEATPFQYWVADWIDDSKTLCEKLEQRCKELNLKGVSFKPYAITPQKGPGAGLPCKGFFITVTDPKNYRPVSTQYVILEVFQNHYKKTFTQKLKKLYEKKDSENKDGPKDAPLFFHKGKVLSYYHQLCWLMGTETFAKQLLEGEFDAQAAIESAQKDCARFSADVASGGKGRVP